uniref:cilia- and flagella-associated protein 43 isoform X2 n=1 Tax=Pristiophorus japonicus TaxID=55135 RepID=UPI00398E96F4
MENADHLSLSWVKGYTTQNVLFVNNNTICYPCGNYLIFMDIDTRKETVLQCERGSIGAFTTNNAREIVAFAEQRLKPLIYLYTFPELSKTAVLMDGAELEYTLLEFSYSGYYFASFSSIPEFSLTIWNWKTSVRLCSESVMGMQANVLSFNPMNQLQLCLASQDCLFIWNIERSDDFHILKRVNVKLPAEDGSVAVPEDVWVGSDCNSLTYYGPRMLLSAQAGLVGKMADTFVPRDLRKPQVQPVSVCWTPSSDLYVGCKKGHLLLVDAELHKAVVLAAPSLEQLNPDIITTNQAPSKISLSVYPMLKLCTVNTMALSTKGLFTAGMGSVHIYDPSWQNNVITLLDLHSEDYVFAGLLGTGKQYCVSARVLGIVQVWSIVDGKNISTLALPVKITVIACCPSSSNVALGTETGSICYINMVTVEKPHLVFQVHLHNVPIQCLQYDNGGQFLVAGCSDGHTFVMNAKPSKNFKVLGYTELKGEVLGLSLPFDSLKRTVNCLMLICQAGEDKAYGGTQLTKFELPAVLTAAASSAVNYHGKMNDAAIQKQNCQMELPLTSAVLDIDQNVYGYSNLTRSIHKYKIAEGKSNDTFELLPQSQVEGQQLGPGLLCLSADQQCLASVAKDGFIQLRDANTMAMYFETQVHSYQSGGVKSIVFSLSSQIVLTTGVHDGTLVCLTARHRDMAGEVVLDRTRSLIEFLDQSCAAEDKVLIVKEQRSESYTSKDKLDTTGDDSNIISGTATRSGVSINSHSSQSSISSVRSSWGKMDSRRSPKTILEPTWLEMKMAEAIEKDNHKNAEATAKLRKGIKKLRGTIKKMMIENESVPEIERLDQYEFNLDLKEQKRLHAEGEEKVAKVRETIEMENLANQYLRDVIKRECWDMMAVKGRTLEAFYSGLAVTNYPMRERSNKELELLGQIKRQRTTELADLKARKDIVETPLKKDEKEDEEAEDEDSREEESTALKGSLTSLYTVVNHYLYKQLDLHTKDEKINQIILLEDVIYNIKTKFNKEFDATYKQKELEIERVKDRSVRIEEIIQQLDMEEEIWLPTLSNRERPERELEVQDSEITAERYLTPEQKRKLEEEFKIEQLQLLAAKADNWRERALKDMMGGVLEVKKSDILKMEIPVPPFMDKPEYEWNEEQLKQAKEFALKEQELNEEKDKYRKTLESEMKKIQGTIAETTNNFDETMNKLFDRKVRTEMIIYQEELKICNLVFSLRIEEELQNRDAQLNYLLSEQKNCTVQREHMVHESKVMVDRYRETYDDLVAEDRLLDRGFRKEFFDVHATVVDQLYKLYKRRPKVQMKRIQVAAASPFGDRLHSASEGHTQLVAAMEELDSPRNAYEGLEPALWNRLIEIRQMKIKSEHQIKLKAVTLAEMHTFLQQRIEEVEKSVQLANSFTLDLSNLRETKSQFQLNLMVQLVLKQGQVEVVSSDFIPDYSNSILLHKGVVEDLNSTIQSLGERKVASMVECKDFKKGIVQLEWEYEKMLMQMDDLHQRIRDILKLRITKQAQMYLRETNYEARVNAHIMGMERSVDGQLKFHSKVIGQKDDRVKDLERQITQLKQELREMDRQLKEQHISVSETQNVHEMTTMAQSSQDARARFKDLVQHNKLMELSRAQAEDIAILRKELERQRMRTFPVLTETEQDDYN